MATTVSPFQLTERFPTIESAVQYFEQVRWKGSPVCTKCKELAVQQRTAWYMLHRLRLACDATPNLLSGIVEIDEPFIRSKEEKRPLRKRVKAKAGTEDKQAVLGTRERGGKTIAESCRARVG